jgi:hypothetical protein
VVVVKAVEKGAAARVMPSSRTKTPTGCPERRMTVSHAELPIGDQRRRVAGRRRWVAAGGAESPSGGAGVALSGRTEAPSTAGGAESPSGDAVGCRGAEQKHRVVS